MNRKFNCTVLSIHDRRTPVNANLYAGSPRKSECRAKRTSARRNKPLRGVLSESQAGHYTSIKKYTRDIWMLQEERLKIVWGCRAHLNVRIETTFADA
jgi:hypothetical protein